MGKPSGIVYFVGAGPGDPRLITRRGWDILQSCDALIYDDLISEELIAAAPTEAEKRYVGKRGWRASTGQETINALLVELAGRRERIVRLKGGDPLIFGRLGEEIEALVSAGIRFEIIPGITSASAAAAAAGFSLTDRRSASWLVFATGHSADSDSPAVPWKELARLEGGAFAIYMGLKDIDVTFQSIAEGRNGEDSPAVVVGSVGRSGEAIVSGTLRDLSGRVAAAKIASPAITLIGNHCAVRRSGEFKPLAGRRVLVTRPAGQNNRFCHLLRELGAEPIPLPTIRTEADAGTDGWRRFHNAVETGGWIIFTSEAGVEFFLRRLLEENLDLRALGKYSIAAIGTGTEEALRLKGLRVDLIPAEFTKHALSEALRNAVDLSGINVVRVRGNLGDPSIEDSANAAGANVIPLNVYRTLYAAWDKAQTERLVADPPDYVTFTSGSTVEGFIAAAGREAADAIAARSRIAVIGPSTAGTVREQGWEVAVTARRFTVEGIVEAIAADVGAGEA